MKINYVASVTFFLIFSFFASQVQSYTVQDLEDVQEIALISALTPVTIILLFGKDGKNDLKRLFLASNEIHALMSAALENNRLFTSTINMIVALARAYKEGLLLINWSDFTDWSVEQSDKAHVFLACAALKELIHNISEKLLKKTLQNNCFIRRCCRVATRAITEGIIDGINIFALNKITDDDESPITTCYHSFLNTLGKETIYQLFGQMIISNANDQSFLADYDPVLVKQVLTLLEAEKNKANQAADQSNNVIVSATTV